MSERLKQLSERASEILAQCVALREPYDGTGKSMPVEIQEQDIRLLDEHDNILQQIENERRLNKAREWANEVPEAMQFSQKEGQATETKKNPYRDSPLQQGFQSWLKGGDSAYVNPGIAGMAEFKALQLDIDNQGGFLTVPMEFVRELIREVDDATYVRGISTIRTVDGVTSLGVPTRRQRMSDPTWTSELSAGGQDESLSFGFRELNPRRLMREILISNDLLRAPGLDVEDIVMQEFAYEFATVEENSFLNGTGAEQPLGVMTASNQGISTSRDVSTSNLATSITADGLIEAAYHLKQQYWGSATWIFHRQAMKQVRQLKDSQGQYLWDMRGQAGITGNLRPTILDFPYLMSEFMPHTFTTGQYVGILGDFRHYWIADALDMQMQRLDEFYARSNQVGFIGRKYTDGMPILEEAFVRVKLA